MSRLTSNRNGIGLIEVLIAIFLLTVGILSLISLQPSAWRLSGKSDAMGRAAGILHQELETAELLVMNANTGLPADLLNQTVRVSGGAADGSAGDVSFLVTRTVVDNANGTWLITITVDWNGNTGPLTESRLASRQNPFFF